MKMVFSYYLSVVVLSLILDQIEEKEGEMKDKSDQQNKVDECQTQEPEPKPFSSESESSQDISSQSSQSVDLRELREKRLKRFT